MECLGGPLSRQSQRMDLVHVRGQLLAHRWRAGMWLQLRARGQLNAREQRVACLPREA